MDEAPQKQRIGESVRELTDRNIRTVRELRRAALVERSLGQRISDAITRFCGSMLFVWIHVAWFAIWIVINGTDVGHLRFDPFPFSLLTMVVSLEAIFLSTFVLVSQNREQELSDRLNQLDLQINLLSEQENSAMLHILVSIARKVGADLEDAPNLSVLEGTKQPEELVRGIDARIEPPKK